MEERFRKAAFDWLRKQVSEYGDVLPRKILEKGFEFTGQRITLMGQPGIWKPGCFSLIPISVTTVINGPYKDVLDDTGLAIYRYRGGAGDIYHRDKAGLREAMKLHVPLIYFYGIAPGKYQAIWPVHVVGDDPNSLCFTLDLNNAAGIIDHAEEAASDYSAGDEGHPVRNYLVAAIKQRLHQSVFRENVLRAYNEQCSFCRLRHVRLLDAAHIIADGEELRDPVVINGMSLCKIHHAAFDSNILGVNPDYVINVREDILHESDGPMLKHGIQEMHGHRIILPYNKKQWPDRERLELRYDRFRNAV